MKKHTKNCFDMIKETKLHKIIVKYNELLLFIVLSFLMLLQRFLNGEYKPVMDDWFLYGNTYHGIAERLSNFAVPNEKFAIRPLAGVFDCFVTAPLFEHLWVVELILTLSLLVGAFFIAKTLKRHSLSKIGFFVCLVCLYPVNLEATYWIAAATRISLAVLFIGFAVFLLDKYMSSKKIGYLILFTLFGAICVCFYEPAVVVYVLLALFIIKVCHTDKKDLIALLILSLQLIVIAIYYIANSSSGELAMRGEIVSDNFFTHIVTVCGYLKDIFVSFSYEILHNGYHKGIDILQNRNFIYSLTIAILSISLGILSSVNMQKRKLSVRFLLLGVALAFGGVFLNFILSSERIPLRLAFFAFIGIGITSDEIFTLLPKHFGRIIYGSIVAVIAFIFTVSGIGEVSEYSQTSQIDVELTKSIIELDTAENITNPDKNVYVFGGQHGYPETRCIHYLEHIRGVSGTYAEITGCMRYLTDVSNTNNILTFTYGDIHTMKPFIDIENVCSFYNIENDRTVVAVTLQPKGDDYNILRSDGSSVGTLTYLGDGKYQFFN